MKDNIYTKEHTHSLKNNKWNFYSHHPEKEIEYYQELLRYPEYLSLTLPPFTEGPAYPIIAINHFFAFLYDFTTNVINPRTVYY